MKIFINTPIVIEKRLLTNEITKLFKDNTVFLNGKKHIEVQKCVYYDKSGELVLASIKEISKYNLHIETTLPEFIGDHVMIEITCYEGK